jgi:hypothetical protein
MPLPSGSTRSSSTTSGARDSICWRASASVAAIDVPKPSALM